MRTLQNNKYELKFTEYGEWGVSGARGKKGTQSSRSFHPLCPLIFPVLVFGVKTCFH
jgi:hypothetical protein